MSAKTIYQKLLTCFYEMRIPWRLRWFKRLRADLRHPHHSCRIIYGYLKDPDKYPTVLLQEMGVQYLREVSEVCARLQMRPFLSFGTLLGYYRDGGFIKHDSDIDLGLMPPDFDKLKKFIAEMKIKGYFTRFDNEYEISFYKPVAPSLCIDFFLFRYKGDKVVYHCRQNNAVYEFAFFKEIFDQFSEVKFLENVRVWIPVQVEQFLELSYGDWRTPKESFDCIYDHPNLTIDIKYEK